jgi:hypothetical protein
LDGRRERQEKKHTILVQRQRTGGSLRGEFLDDIKLDLNEDYCKAVG